MTQSKFTQRWRASREMQARARKLRQDMPPAEVRLWQAIRYGQLNGAHFRRQHTIGTYILDFFCAKSRLAIELDGSQHNYQKEYDADRTRWLETEKGIRIIRFANYEVMWDLESVIEKIKEELE